MTSFWNFRPRHHDCIRLTAILNPGTVLILFCILAWSIFFLAILCLNLDCSCTIKARSLKLPEILLSVRWCLALLIASLRLN